jgi:molybdopterin-biosynthesis enzyme MoeA-like protein
MTKNRTISLIIIGDEILSGKRQDKHLQQAISLLKPIGLSVDLVSMVSDNADLLVETLKQSFQQGNITFCFGGIGSTPDDRTRQSAAKALGLSVKRHAKAAKEIINQLGDKAYPLPITMSDYPDGADMIPNFYNNIPGFSINEHYFMPGFPIMAKDMMEWVLQTYYQDLSRPTSIERAIRIVDGKESEWVIFMREFEQQYPILRIFSLPTITENDGRNVELGVEGIEPVVHDGFADILAHAKKLKANFAEI